ncbi:hypothetical protein O6H91_14G078100 [Diphasiastrum complanatum]|uniref:Uncharacterized protein n=1 Tax=Diphasiastrum complanatum TaxID=34168 RepID=A0ACC2BR32_DIPCM|nr:hypothetical protein O6H91_14G078100 [Diphasiastrum complanatum]
MKQEATAQILSSKTLNSNHCVFLLYVFSISISRILLLRSLLQRNRCVAAAAAAAVMGKGTGSFGKRRNKSHTLCRRCGRRSFHIQKSRCAACAYPAKRIRHYNWSVKAIRRKTTGTGRMRHLRHLPRLFKNNFREGTEAAPKKKVAASSY